MIRPANLLYHPRLLFLGSLAIGCFAVVGCGPGATPAGSGDNASHGGQHQHDDHHGHSHELESFGQAVTELDKLTTEIMTAFSVDDPGSAHGPLHHVADVLEATETAIGKSELPQNQKDSAIEAVESLFDAFTAIDDTIHGNTVNGSLSDVVDEEKTNIMDSLDTLKTLSAK